MAADRVKCGVIARQKRFNSVNPKIRPIDITDTEGLKDGTESKKNEICTAVDIPQVV